ncbi:MAG: aldose 1-epimerase [Anaerolineae bacterium]
MTAKRACLVQEVLLGRTLRALRLENDQLRATVLLDKGADIYELVYKPRGVDVLWKTPWGLREPARGAALSLDSETTWLEYYPGGWQVLFPNGGDECSYHGVRLNMHGEASLIAWECHGIFQGATFAEVQLETRLLRSPFRMRRTLRVEQGRPALFIHERITNEAGEPMDYMWGHHPAFGAPFLSGACWVDTAARTLLADEVLIGTHNPLQGEQRYIWPLVETASGLVDMSRVPGLNEPRYTLGYLADFESGWYAITNPELGFGVGLSWPVDVFPYAWLWQEMHASAGFPFYKNCYTMAIEPNTSIPGRGLTAVMKETATHCTLAPGQSAEVTLCAVFYPANGRVQRIDLDGTVHPEHNR